ncbi:MAG: helix-turn-helix transcriptional regulator [Thermoguttaceae bacterium]|nr:helix-turn-helix transcriptional regulator [Thermoguttaceae bacterium]
MDDFERYLSERMRDPEFREEYEALEPKYALIRQLIEIRREQNLTQAELARRIGIQRSHLARLESGDFNPTFQTLQKIAKGLGKKLTMTFS